MEQKSNELAQSEAIQTFNQDRTATYIVLYMTSIVCVLTPIMLQTFASLTTLLLGTSSLFYMLAARTVHLSDGQRLRYFDPCSPKRQFATLILLGIVQITYWRTSSHLLYHTHANLWLLDYSEAVLCAIYFAYALWRSRSSRFNVQVVGFFLATSIAVLASVAFYKHFTRNTNFLHIRDDWRLFYLGICQVVHFLLLTIGTKFFQAWFLQALALPFYILIGVCGMHKRLLF